MNQYFGSVLFIYTLLTNIHDLHTFDENVYNTFAGERHDSYDSYTDDEHDLPQFNLDNKRLYEEGRHQYEILERNGNHYGVCWQTAIASLHSSCSRLDDEVQSRLALAFANCFLQKAGMQTYACDASFEVKLCVKDMSDRAFISYTEFFTHTQSICFFLQNQVWQQNTEQTVHKLAMTSAKVSDKLEDASQSLQRLRDLQHISISSQQSLNEQITQSRNIIEDFKTSTSEQNYIVKEILDRFIRLQDFVLIEVSHVYSVIFFIVLMIVVYLLTTPKRTRDARLSLFIIFIANLFSEYLIASYLTNNDLSFNMRTTSVSIHQKVLVSRYITLIVMVVVLIWFWFSYKNYGAINYQILTQNTMTLIEIKRRIENFENNFQRGFINTGNNQLMIKTCDNNGYVSSNSDSDYVCNSDSESSGFDDEDSDASFVSMATNSTIPTVSSSTANKSNNFSNESQNLSLEIVKSEIMEPLNTSTEFSDNLLINGYNLRPRKSPNRSLYLNRFQNESVEAFSAKVNLSANLSRINRKRINNVFSQKDNLFF